MIFLGLMFLFLQQLLEPFELLEPPQLFKPIQKTPTFIP